MISEYVGFSLVRFSECHKWDGEAARTVERYQKSIDDLLRKLVQRVKANQKEAVSLRNRRKPSRPKKMGISKPHRRLRSGAARRRNEYWGKHDATVTGRWSAKRESRVIPDLSNGQASYTNTVILDNRNTSLFERLLRGGRFCSRRASCAVGRRPDLRRNSITEGLSLPRFERMVLEISISR